MLEFGSDYHFNLNGDKFYRNEFSNSNSVFFANGRQALRGVIEFNSWKRIWIPEYFCHEVTNAIKTTGIDVLTYPDYPLNDECSLISCLDFKKEDVILRINYFGMRSRRDNKNIPVQVIEDHSHDLTGEWATNSNADYCIASLRKTLPLPEGGILWSPLNHSLPSQGSSSLENDLISYQRLSAMLLKALYINDCASDKSIYRKIFLETESAFADLKQSGMSNICLSLFNNFNISDWYKQKKKNWFQLATLAEEGIDFLKPEDIKSSTPFSFILRLPNKDQRDSLRNALIRHLIYPAILWNLPIGTDPSLLSISEILLSIHCDSRYDSKQMEYLKNQLINDIHSINI
jgi:hypothetical protein